MAENDDLIEQSEFDKAPLCPSLTIPDVKKDKKWYRTCVRYFALFYNVNRQNMGDVTGNRSYFMNPVDRIVQNFRYSMGTQNSGIYSFFTPDFQGITQDELGIVPGKKLASLCNFMRGTALKMINNMRIEAMSISPDAKTKEMEMMDKLLFSQEMDGWLSEMEQQDGMNFTPAGDFKPQIKEDAIRWMERDFKELMVEGADLIARGLLYANDFVQLFLKEFVHAMTAGYCGIEVQVRDGQVIWDHIPSWLAIPDLSRDDDFNKDARYAGRINYLTPSEIFSRYNCDDDEKKLINELSTTNATMLGQYNLNIENINSTNANFPSPWWNGNKSQPVVACVTMYWKARQDLPYKTESNEFNTLKVKKTKRRSKPSEFEYEGWEQATLIGNLVLKNYGAVPNRVGMKEKYIKNDCPIKYFIPNLNMGEVVSVVDLLKSSQDRIDAINTKIIDLIGKDIGYTATLNGSALGNVHVEKILADWKVNGFTVINGSTGEPYDDNTLKSLLMSSKIGGSDYIADYMSFKEQEKREMEEIANIPLITLGQQKSNTGLGVQQNTIDQSTLGTYTLYNGFVQWCSQLTQYSANVAKWVYTIDDDFSARVQVGDFEFKYLKLTRDIRLEELGVRFVVKDIISDPAKDRIRAYVQAFVQNGQLDPLDALMIDRAESYTEMINDLEYSIRKRERKAEEREAQMQMIKIAEGEQNRELVANTAQLQAETSTQNTDKKAQAQILDTAIKQDPALLDA